MAIRTIAEDEGVLHSRKGGQVQPYYAVPFAESGDAVMNDTYSGNGSVFMRDTPQLFVDMGFSELPIMTTAKHIKSIYSAKQMSEDHNHDLGELIKQIPEKFGNISFDGSLLSIGNTYSIKKEKYENHR